MKQFWTGLALLALGAAVILLPYHVAMTGLCLIGYGALFLLDCLFTRRGWKKGWHSAARAVGISVFLILTAGMCVIGWNGRTQGNAASRADYAVVLGAQIHGTKPSRTLRERLDAAYDFQKKNPGMTLIVSGGKGDDEGVNEATVMYGYLASRGADMSRVVKEEASHNTRENLVNSAAIAERMGLDSCHPVIITSEFHLCRAKYIAGTIGLDAVGVSSRTTPWILMVNDELREVFAFAKAWAVAAVA